MILGSGGDLGFRVLLRLDGVTLCWQNIKDSLSPHCVTVAPMLAKMITVVLLRNMLAKKHRSCYMSTRSPRAFMLDKMIAPAARAYVLHEESWCKSIHSGQNPKPYSPP